MDDQSPKEVAHKQGARVWNQWDSSDPEVQVAAEAAEKQAEADQNDADFLSLKADSPDDDPTAVALLEEAGLAGTTGPVEQDATPTGAGGPKPKRSRSSNKSS